jgi:hypothetical protein
MDIISTEKGSYDLCTSKGQYGYVCEYLVAHGARGDILSCMEKLYKNAQENAQLREALKEILNQYPVDYEIRITEIARKALKGAE